MSSVKVRSLLVIVSLLCAKKVRSGTSTPNTGDQLQSFTFSYTTSNLVIPTISTCPTPLTLTQLTTTNSGGPDPIAPYTMILLVHEQLIDGGDVTYERMYSKTLDVGTMSGVQSISHPWWNGTQFIGCIWGSNGVSGGCQDLTTVVPGGLGADSGFANASSECRKDDVVGSWVTDPAKTLDVLVEGVSGTVSQNAWPDACTDLRFTPRNGTSPYTLLIAPAFHPPINITSHDKSPMNYTIRLTHGQAFMAGVYDSVGNSFAIGPFHSGESQDLSCLASLPGQAIAGDRSKSVGYGALAGGAVGGFIIGALGALAVMWAMNRRTKRGKQTSESQVVLTDPYADPRPSPFHSHSSRWSKNNTHDQTPIVPFDSPLTPYDPPHASPFIADGVVQPFPRPQAKTTERPISQRDTMSLQEFGHRPADALGLSGSGRSVESGNGGGDSGRGEGSGGKATRMHVVGGVPASPDTAIQEVSDEGGSSERMTRNVHVVHSDGGGGDVHIQLPQGGARVIELPPTYIPGAEQSPPNPNPDRRPLSTASGYTEHSLSPSRRNIQLGSSPPSSAHHPTRGISQPQRRDGISANERESQARAEAAQEEKGRLLAQ